MNITRFLRRLVLQLVLSFFLFCIPVYWVAYSNHSLSSFGLAAAASGFCYLLLPWDLIPDWIPLVGKLDNLVALTVFLGGGFAAGVGLLLAL